MAANNAAAAGRQNNNNNNNNNNAAGGGGAGMSNSDHVEFSVRAAEDLYLEGSEATIRRVTADTNYSCLMLKTQRFSSLFRHYAKYHGLRKDDLEYYFVNLLENEDTPESVQLQRGDTIMVRKRRKAEIPEAAASDDDFFANMKELLEQEEHMDVIFQLYANNVNSVNTSSSASNNNPTSRRCHPQQKQQQQPVQQHSIKSENEEESTTNMEAMETSNFNNNNIIVNNGAAAKGDNSNTVTAEVRAHKAVLMARTEHFRNMFSGEEGPQAVPSASLEDDEEDEEEMEDEDVVQEEEEEEEDYEETNKSPHVYSHKKKTTTKRSTSTATTASTTVNLQEDHCSSSAEQQQQLTLVQVDPEFTEHHIRLALEFIYTNRLVDIRDIATDDLLALLKLSHLWLLRDLKRLVELELIRSHISSDTVARLYGAADGCAGKRLKDAALKFIMANLKALTSNVQFKEEMKNFPELCIPVLKAAADLIPDGPVHKKQRTDLATGTPSSAIAAFRSSPVPDSDQ